MLVSFLYGDISAMVANISAMVSTISAMVSYSARGLTITTVVLRHTVQYRTPNERQES